MLDGGFRRHTIYSDRPYSENRWFDVPGKVTRLNPGTFLGMYFIVPQVDTGSQFWNSGETTAIDHLRIGWEINYNEYNENFDQTP